MSRPRTLRVAAAFAPYIGQGFEVAALTASRGEIMKFEWPLLLPQDHAVRRLAAIMLEIEDESATQSC